MIHARLYHNVHIRMKCSPPVAAKRLSANAAAAWPVLWTVCSGRSGDVAFVLLAHTRDCEVLDSRKGFALTHEHGCKLHLWG